MNDVDYPVREVLDGIEAAAAVGLATVKINCVVERGTNDCQILPLVEHFRHSGHVLRFIEYMDVGSSNAWTMDEVLPSEDVIKRIAKHYSLLAIGANHPDRSLSGGAMSMEPTRSVSFPR